MARGPNYGCSPWTQRESHRTTAGAARSLALPQPYLPPSSGTWTTGGVRGRPSKCFDPHVIAGQPGSGRLRYAFGGIKALGTAVRITAWVVAWRVRVAPRLGLAMGEGLAALREQRGRADQVWCCGEFDRRPRVPPRGLRSPGFCRHPRILRRGGHRISPVVRWPVGHGRRTRGISWRVFAGQKGPVQTFLMLPC